MPFFSWDIHEDNIIESLQLAIQSMQITTNLEVVVLGLLDPHCDTKNDCKDSRFEPVYGLSILDNDSISRNLSHLVSVSYGKGAANDFMQHAWFFIPHIKAVCDFYDSVPSEQKLVSKEMVVPLGGEVCVYRGSSSIKDYLVWSLCRSNSRAVL